LAGWSVFSLPLISGRGNVRAPGLMERHWGNRAGMSVCRVLHQGGG
jgi:hypothetical protein